MLDLSSSVQDQIQARAADLGITLRFGGQAHLGRFIPPRDVVFIELGGDDVRAFDTICHTTIGDEPDDFACSWFFRDPLTLTGMVRTAAGFHQPPLYVVPKTDLPGLLDRLNRATTCLTAAGGADAARRRHWLLSLFYFFCVVAFFGIRDGHYLLSLIMITGAVVLHSYAARAEADVRLAKWLRAKADEA